MPRQTRRGKKKGMSPTMRRLSQCKGTVKGKSGRPKAKRGYTWVAGYGPGAGSRAKCPVKKAALKKAKKKAGNRRRRMRIGGNVFTVGPAGRRIRFKVNYGGKKRKGAKYVSIKLPKVAKGLGSLKGVVTYCGAYGVKTNKAGEKQVVCTMKLPCTNPNLTNADGTKGCKPNAKLRNLAFQAIGKEAKKYRAGWWPNAVSKTNYQTATGRVNLGYRRAKPFGPARGGRRVYS